MRTVRSASAVPEAIREVDTLVDPDYTDAFQVSIVGVDARSPEQWARSTFEGAPMAVRWFLLAGWRMVLGLRLGPRPSPEHVLGWTILGRGAHWAMLELRSPLLTAHLVFWVDDARVVQSTFVRYERRVAAFVWPPVSIIHRRAIPYLLRHAVSHPWSSSTCPGLRPNNEPF